MGSTISERMTKPYGREYNRCRVLSIPKNHKYYESSNKGNIAESRLLMAEHLERNLTKDDIVLGAEQKPRATFRPFADLGALLEDEE